MLKKYLIQLNFPNFEIFGSFRIFSRFLSKCDVILTGTTQGDEENEGGEGGEYDNDSMDDSDQSKKKNRTAFTPHQICELEKRFRVQKYLSASERGEFALSLKLTDTQVSLW